MTETCCGNCSGFYKARVIVLAALSCLEAVFGLFRYVIFLSPALSSGGAPDLSNVANLTDPIVIAFVLYVGSSIMGHFIVFLLALSQFPSCFACGEAMCRDGTEGERKNHSKPVSSDKAVHRFIAFDCNCPLYRVGPKLRFRL